MSETMYFAHYNDEDVEYIGEITEERYISMMFDYSAYETYYKVEVPSNDKYTCYDLEGIKNDTPTAIFDTVEQANVWASSWNEFDTIRMVIHECKIIPINFE